MENFLCEESGVRFPFALATRPKGIVGEKGTEQPEDTKKKRKLKFIGFISSNLRTSWHSGGEEEGDRRDGGCGLERLCNNNNHNSNSIPGY
jgi:hypothetical protein